MLNRHIDNHILEWMKNKTAQGLLIAGARQVGKTTAVREFAFKHYDNLAEVNFYENSVAKTSLNEATNTNDLLFRLSLLTGKEIIPNKTLLFLDEIQECQDALTWVKFLAGDKHLDVIISGSLLGLDAFVNVRSIPVGFLEEIKMFPMTFSEFCEALGIHNEVWNTVKEHLCSFEKIPDYLHQMLFQRCREYLLIGGMPDAVQAFVDTSQIVRTRRIQGNILNLYRADISKYVDDKTEARQIKMAFDSIPAQLNTPSKRFKYSRLNKNLRFSNLETAFDWITHAGIAIQATRVSEIQFPLRLSEDISKFKFFLNDVGLLTQTLMQEASIEIINGTNNINYGSIYEAFVAQELLASGLTPHYYSSKKLGEIDFVIENSRTGNVLPIEVKSGKDYKRHSALLNYLNNDVGQNEEAIILHNGNIEQVGKRIYLPIYATSLIKELFL